MYGYEKKNKIIGIGEGDILPNIENMLKLCFITDITIYDETEEALPDLNKNVNETLNINYNLKLEFEKQV